MCIYYLNYRRNLLRIGLTFSKYFLMSDAKKSAFKRFKEGFEVSMIKSMEFCRSRRILPEGIMCGIVALFIYEIWSVRGAIQCQCQ